jgi:hypothetical protein
LTASALAAAFAVNTFTIVAAQPFAYRLLASWGRSRGLAVTAL